MCRFSQLSVDAWSALHKHIEAGHYPLVQQAMVRGETPEDMRTGIAAAEARKSLQPTQDPMSGAAMPHMFSKPAICCQDQTTLATPALSNLKSLQSQRSP